MDNEPDIVIADVLEASRYEMHRGGERIGHLNYQRSDGRMILTHVEVDPALEGRGLGSRLTEAVLQDFRTKGMTVIPECPFIVRFMREHPEYADLLG
ncbi:MAG: GNAT family N-acetyltransferase [Actinomycetota bacterium]